MMKLILVVALCVFSTCIHGKFNRKIFNGKPIHIEKVPYQVGLGDATQIWCGGSIVSDRFILTAGHCLDESDHERELIIYVGMSMKSRISPDMMKPVRNFTIHPLYVSDGSYANYDIAVVELQNAVEFNDRIQPVEMAPSFEPVPIGADAYVSGWGKLNENGIFPTRLHGVKLKILPPEDCNFKVFDSKHMLCAGSRDVAVNACEGDSGGPLVSDGILYGIVSFGSFCADPGYPGVYANVAGLRDFIDAHIV